MVQFPQTLFVYKWCISGQAQCDPAKHFACTNGACVKREVECDGVDDCGDNSDETIPCGKYIESWEAYVYIWVVVVI